MPHRAAVTRRAHGASCGAARDDTIPVSDVLGRPGLLPTARERTSPLAPFAAGNEIDDFECPVAGGAPLTR